MCVLQYLKTRPNHRITESANRVAKFTVTVMRCVAKSAIKKELELCVIALNLKKGKRNLQQLLDANITLVHNNLI